MTTADQSFPESSTTGTPETAGAEPGFESNTEPAQSPAGSALEAAESVTQAASIAIEDTAETVASLCAAATDDVSEVFQNARSRLQAIGTPEPETMRKGVEDVGAWSASVSQQSLAGYAQGLRTLSELHAKALEAWRTNAEATLAHWQQLAGVRNWSEMIALNAVHTRKQIEAVSAQTRELAELAGRLAGDARTG